MSGAIHQWTARQTRQAIRGKETSATEIAQALLARIARLDGRDAPGGGLGAFLHVDPARVLARAAALDAEHATAADRPLFGVPVAVKDNLCTRGVPTTAASRILERFVPPFTATAVERLEAAGAIVLGKTNCDEFAMGSSTENSALGVTRNPWAFDEPVQAVDGGALGPASKVRPHAFWAGNFTWTGLVRSSSLRAWRWCGHFERQVRAIAPLPPRAQVVADLGKAQEPQREISVRAAVAALAVPHHVALLRHPEPRVHRLQLGRRLEAAGGRAAGQCTRRLGVTQERDVVTYARAATAARTRISRCGSWAFPRSATASGLVGSGRSPFDLPLKCPHHRHARKGACPPDQARPGETCTPMVGPCETSASTEKRCV